jgi:uncharacterized protein
MKKKNPENLSVVRIEEVKLALEENETALGERICQILGIGDKELLSFTIIKKAIDARNRNRIYFVYSLDLVLKDGPGFFKKIKEAVGDKADIYKRHKVREVAPYTYNSTRITKTPKIQPVVVGSGPAGLFCTLALAKAGLNPIMIERGSVVSKRIKDVDSFFRTGDLNPESNVQFGEGGAGTFSDGKLYTLVNDPRSKYIFDEFVEAGAPPEILYDANPHIGTDNLRELIVNLRKKIENLGGEIRFDSKLTNLSIKKERITEIEINNKENLKVDTLILALGHSARDTYEMLFERGVAMCAKTFSIGVRIEHKAEMINKAQYGKFYNHPKLPTARYKLVAHLPENRSVYSFCMCPGGYVVAASSEASRLAVNGMSRYAQDGENSNSALLVNVFPDDFMSGHPLAGIAFQREWEEKAYTLGGGGFIAPAQRLEDFLKSKKGNLSGDIKPTYAPGVISADLSACLPDFVFESLKKAIPILEQKIKGFAHPDAILTALESRSSSPLRIIRNENFEASILGIYPIGEGSGYAGGITSSAIDGLKAAESIIKKYIAS